MKKPKVIATAAAVALVGGVGVLTALAQINPVTGFVRNTAPSGGGGQALGLEGGNEQAFGGAVTITDPSNNPACLTDLRVRNTGSGVDQGALNGICASQGL